MEDKIQVHDPARSRAAPNIRPDIRPDAAKASNAEIDALMAEIRSRCNGMLRASVYRAIYEAGYQCGGGTLVEVGTAHAAGTISLALGMQASGHQGSIYTFDKIAGGSRDAFGDIETNRRIIEGNLAHFGVSHLVKLCIGDVADNVDKVPAHAPINLLMLDADGRIDRDFQFFFKRLAAGAPVIIDDVVEVVRVNRLNRKRYKVDSKMKLSFLLLRHFIHQGLITPGRVIGATYFGHAPDPAAKDVDLEGILAVYRELVFSEAPRQGLGNHVWRGVSRAFLKRFPKLHEDLRLALKGKAG